MINSLSNNGTINGQAMPSTAKNLHDDVSSLKVSLPLPTVASDSVNLSGAAQKLLDQSNRVQGDVNPFPMLRGIADEPEFAKEMAYNYAFIRDSELVNLKDVPLDGTGFDAYSKHVTAFEAQADSIRAQRINIYNEMSAKNATGAEIFHALMDFNRGLPEAYLKNTGLDRVLSTVSVAR